MQHNPGFLALVNESKKQIKEYSIQDVVEKHRRGDKFHLVDTREDSEWDKGRIAGAIHIGKGVIERDIETKIPDKNADVVLYCGGGFRSALAAEVLQKMGYKNVSSMDGGWRAWTAAELPTEK